MNNFKWINRDGRRDMKRSAPFDKIENKEVQIVQDEEEEDKKYFLDSY